ncbi:hypothetical protein PENSPDRAFT_666256 [Peniophora sp. CONT]|nr:hypothetical protein PENSPDRAFT_666256 [Peniophora sp. CONT]
MTNASVLEVLREEIEFPRLWRVDAVNDCQFVLNALRYYQVQEARTIAALVEHFEPTGTTVADRPITRVPTIAEYPPREELLWCCRRVMNGLGLLALSDELRVLHDSMTATWLVYNLDELRWLAHGHEVWINCTGDMGASGWSMFDPQRSAFGPFEPRHGKHIVQALVGFDEVVNFHYRRCMMGSRVDGTFGSAIHRPVMEQLANMCLRIMSKFASQQKLSGQTPATFYNELRRPAADLWLALVYSVIHQEMKTEEMDKFDALRIAERITSPLDGALMQGKYIVSVFRRVQTSNARWLSMPAEVRFAMRGPANIWHKFKTCCIGCLTKADKICSRCREVRYCGEECQRAHWRRSHKTACSIYALTPLALTVDPANDEA